MFIFKQHSLNRGPRNLVLNVILFEFYSPELQNIYVSLVSQKLCEIKRKISRTNTVPKSAHQALTERNAKMFSDIFKIIKIYVHCLYLPQHSFHCKKSKKI